MGSNEGAAPLHAWRGGRGRQQSPERGIIIQVKKVSVRWSRIFFNKKKRNTVRIYY